MTTITLSGDIKVVGLEGCKHPKPGLQEQKVVKARLCIGDPLVLAGVIRVREADSRGRLNVDDVCDLVPALVVQ